MKRVLLIDVDSKIPNLALMKLSGYYKELGFKIVLYRFGFSGYSHALKPRKYINAVDYDMVFVSIIFRCNKDVIKVDGCDQVFYGGSGYDIKVKLPQEVDDYEEDYSIYPDNNISYGFITRGCIRNCSFCIVPEKEGPVYKYRTIEQIIKHKKVKFLDNNILAYDGCKNILQVLVDNKIRCEFNQGLDIRLVDDKIAELLSRLNYINDYTFAFDSIKYLPIMNEKIKILKRYISRDWNIRVFIYCNANADIHQDVLRRIQWCKTHKVLPYIMRDENCYKSTFKRFYSELTRWSCQPALFKNLSFKGFMAKRPISEQSKKNILETFYE